MGSYTVVRKFNWYNSLAFNLSGDDIVFEANFTQFPGVDPTTQAILNAVAAPAIDFSSSFGDEGYVVAETIALAFAGQAFRLAVKEAEVSIKNPLDADNPVVVLSGGIAIERIASQEVIMTDGSKLQNISGVTLVGKGLSGSINLPLLGEPLTLKGVDVGMALMANGLGLDADYYLALTTEVEGNDDLINIPGINFELIGAELHINTKLNRDLADDGLNPPAIDFSSSYAMCDFVRSYLKLLA
ncbi:hypothetical protein [Endozoicomonas atrinae]|uniref:hypothetical protein n=1 Tax=Endozoicomonas atrinae TaxID=1333660 RepID=UPI0008258718|nr:hypothetical protein [Endozoicomonas atrinae]